MDQFLKTTSLAGVLTQPNKKIIRPREQKYNEYKNIVKGYKSKLLKYKNAFEFYMHDAKLRRKYRKKINRCKHNMSIYKDKMTECKYRYQFMEVPCDIRVCGFDEDAVMKRVVRNICKAIEERERDHIPKEV